jgi:membrane-bound metal-dependent hydrolase YbcI (DUF457 family)
VAHRDERLERLRVYSDPFQHAAIAAVVTSPLAAAAGRPIVATAVTAALVIDVDHAVAARSLKVKALISLDTRPRTHSLVAATAAGALMGTLAGPAHGWAAFSGLVSHLLHDAGDQAAPTPMLWPVRPARQLGRRWQLAASAALLVGSVLVSRATASGTSRASAGDGGTAPPRTA